MSDGTGLRAEFLLDRDVTFLNHGSFGACPRAVFERYQEWQLELERQPVLFLARRLEGLLAEARAALGGYIGADPEDLVFVPNATAGVNIAAWPLGLRAGDEVLSTNLEYGALDLAWEHVCGDFGARYVRTPIPPPVASEDEIAEAIWSGVTPQTRVLFLSHHTSSTAPTLPVAELCRRARKRGIVTVIDGAHIPGHLPLNISELDPDFYAGNCHKWRFHFSESETAVACASVPHCALSERADGSGERGLGSACLQRRGQLIGVGSWSRAVRRNASRRSVTAAASSGLPSPANPGSHSP